MNIGLVCCTGEKVRDVFQTDEFKSWAKENVILLELDFPRRKKLEPNLESSILIDILVILRTILIHQYFPI